MKEFDVAMVDMARNDAGDFVVTPKLLALLAAGKEPRTGALAYLRALAEECTRHRATMKRLEAWADELDEDTLTSGRSGVGPFIAAELRNRMKGE